MIIFLLFLSFWIGLSIIKNALLCSLIAVILVFISIKKYSKKSIKFIACAFAIGIGISSINISRDKNTITAVVFSAKENYVLVNSFGEKLYVYEKDNPYNVGDVLILEGERNDLSFISLESQFNFKNYLNNKGVKKEFKAKSITIKFKSLFDIKKNKDSFLNKFTNETSKQFASSILFSDYDEEDILNVPTHVTKLIRCSGIYFNCFTGFLSFIFLIIGKKKKWCELASICISGLIFRNTIFSIVFLKTYLTKITKWYFKYVSKRKISSLTVYSLIGILMLLLNKNLACDYSFIISFLLPIASSLITPSIDTKIKLKNRLIRSLLIYLLFIPFEITFYNSIAPLSFLISLILSPLYKVLGTVIILSFLSIPLMPVLNMLSIWSKGINNLLSFMNFELYLGEYTILLIIAYYCLLALAFYLILVKFKPLIKYAFSLVLLMLVVSSLPMKNLNTNEVAFINVGQGDCTMIRTKTHVTLIDTGGSNYTDIANNVLINYFKKHKIYSIDNVIITHNDIDHNGALYNLVKDFKVKNIVTDQNAFPFTWRNLTFKNYNSLNDGDDNSKSLVIGFEIEKTNFLITGDAPVEVENKIINSYSYIPCDILKIGHHGSNTSSSYAFLNYLKPVEAVISVGKNYYGHPSKDVINRLRKLNILVRRTDLEGTISYCFKQ